MTLKELGTGETGVITRVGGKGGDIVFLVDDNLNSCAYTDTS